MKLIGLTQGKFAMVDDEDFERLNQFKWYAHKGPHNNTYYAIRNIKTNNPKKRQKKIQMHRVVMNIVNTKLIIDHKDRNGLNCQKYNLRIATVSQNAMNKQANKNSSSKYLGVSLKTDKRRNTTTWRAAVWANGKSVYEKCFKTETEAAKAYNKIAKKYHGEFANLNNIKD